MGVYDTARPDTEVFELSDGEKQEVLEQVRRRQVSCDSCGSTEFGVGHALYLGFLFVNEEQRDYMVGLTCGNPACPSPRTGIRLHEPGFFENAPG